MEGRPFSSVVRRQTSEQAPLGHDIMGIELSTFRALRAPRAGPVFFCPGGHRSGSIRLGGCWQSSARARALARTSAPDQGKSMPGFMRLCAQAVRHIPESGY